VIGFVAAMVRDHLGERSLRTLNSRAIMIVAAPRQDLVLYLTSPI